MKSYLSLLFLLVFHLSFSQIKENFKIPNKPKIGLSLAGGGAKGFAHVGALKVLDSLGVKIDYISGTSMGAIVGGLYASGYSGKEIEKIVKKTDFIELLNNEKKREEVSFFNKNNDKYIVNIPIKKGKLNFLPQSISAGQKNIYMLKDLFKDVSYQKDFSKLPIPFMCMATNLETGKLKVFDKGDLIKSIMASAAFPSLLAPVTINDSIYIDGAMTVNYPSKQLKDKGIDIVIGIDLNQGLKTRKELNSAIDIINQVVDFQIQEDTSKQYHFTDINIKPELKNYSATSYNDKDSILLAGYEETKKYYSILNQLPKEKFRKKRARYQSNFSNLYKIDSLDLKGNTIFNKNYVKGKMNLKIPSLQTYENINTMIDKLYATNNYELISYDLETSDGVNRLKIDLNENKTRFFLKFGLHYDEIYKTGLLINLTFKRPILNNSTISLDAVVGDQPRYYFNYYIDNGYLPSFGVSSTGTSFNVKTMDNELLDKWIWFRNKTFLQSTWRDRYAIGIGLNHDYIETKRFNSTNFINAYGFIKSDTRNHKYFPTKGIYFNSEIMLIDLFNKDITKKIIQTNGNFSLNIPINNTLTFRTNVFGGFTIGEQLPYYYKYRSGGIFKQEIIHFQPFSGLYFGSLESKNIVTTLNELQFKIKKKFYATLQYSMLNDFENINLKELNKIKQNTVGIEGGYDSPFGQIKLNYSYNINNNKNILNVILGHWF